MFMGGFVVLAGVWYRLMSCDYSPMLPRFWDYILLIIFYRLYLPTTLSLLEGPKSTKCCTRKCRASTKDAYNQNPFAMPCLRHQRRLWRAESGDTTGLGSKPQTNLPIDAACLLVPRCPCHTHRHIQMSPSTELPHNNT